jgi:hypothetical protein
MVIIGGEGTDRRDKENNNSKILTSVLSLVGIGFGFHELLARASMARHPKFASLSILKRGHWAKQ